MFGGPKDSTFKDSNVAQISAALYYQDTYQEEYETLLSNDEQGIEDESQEQLV